MLTPRDARAQAKEWQAARAAQRRQDQRARSALESLVGGSLYQPMSLHPLRMLSPFPTAGSDDLGWNPVDVFGEHKVKP